MGKQQEEKKVLHLQILEPCTDGNHGGYDERRGLIILSNNGDITGNIGITKISGRLKDCSLSLNGESQSLLNYEFRRPPQELSAILYNVLWLGKCHQETDLGQVSHNALCFLYEKGKFRNRDVLELFAKLFIRREVNIVKSTTDTTGSP